MFTDMERDITMNEKIIENFLSLCAIPHKSHHEEKISRFLYDWAVKKGLAAVRDEEGNVIIDKAGSAGHEDAPRTILQAHMDMSSSGRTAWTLIRSTIPSPLSTTAKRSRPKAHPSAATTARRCACDVHSRG